MLLEDQAANSMANLDTAIDALVDATATFATVGAVADMAADASAGDVEDQQQTQEMLGNHRHDNHRGRCRRIQHGGCRC